MAEDYSVSIELAKAYGSLMKAKEEILPREVDRFVDGG
jgi:hypothetical protein